MSTTTLNNEFDRQSAEAKIIIEDARLFESKQLNAGIKLFLKHYM